MAVQSEETVAPAPTGRPVFHRILLKLSGESLMGDLEYGMDRATIDAIAEEIIAVHAEGVEIAIVGTVTFEAVDGAVIEGYVHPPANKLGVLVQLRGGSPELARKVAMHIAASAPQWIGRDDVPEEVVSTERDIFANSDEVQSKPEQAREKIVEGMLNKRFFGDRVLVDQPWIHDTGKTVGQALGEEGADVLEFERLALTG